MNLSPMAIRHLIRKHMNLSGRDPEFEQRHEVLAFGW
jgi:hypothetical protein